MDGVFQHSTPALCVRVFHPIFNLTLVVVVVVSESGVLLTDGEAKAKVLYIRYGSPSVVCRVPPLTLARRRLSSARL